MTLQPHFRALWATLALAMACPLLGQGFGNPSPTTTPMEGIPEPPQPRPFPHPLDKGHRPIEFEEPYALPMPEVGGQEPVAQWAGAQHSSITSICAGQWGLSSARVNMMSGASTMPDVYDNEGTVPGTQQWKHGWVQLVNGLWIWGSADAECNNNIRGNGLNGKSAFYYYDAGNQSWGDWYLGYAAHYLEDVGNPWHTSANIVQQVTTHAGFEAWVNNNWTNGWNLSQSVSGDYYYYAVSDPAAATRQLAIYSNSKNSAISSQYNTDGKPTGAGSGSTALVNYTKDLLQQTARYAKGLIKFTLDAKRAW